MVTTRRLADFLSINRRFTRSINLERDFDDPKVVEGYILTDRALDALQRIVASVFGRKRTTAWTLTGVYGTGKSAFVHFLISLVGPSNSQARRLAMDIARQSLSPDSPEFLALEKGLSPKGLFRAFATAQREPLRYTIARALEQGANDYWHGSSRPEIARELTDWAASISGGKARFTDADVLEQVKRVVEIAETDVILVIDELGKSLEYATHNQAVADLYLLQQLAELSRQKGTRLYVVGLLHRAFADYSRRLASLEKDEWGKIQGRYEDIAFTESTDQMLRLVGQAIKRSQPEQLAFPIHQLAEDWCHILSEEPKIPDLSPKLLEAAYPLHPISALVLSELCIQYAQSDRSLFTFLSSAEPYAFQSFLEETEIKDGALPSLKLHHLYDYFEASLGGGIGSRSGSQRWFEIQTLVADAKRKKDEESQGFIALYKTIGLLNLVTKSTTSLLRASRSLVKLALVDQPERETLEYWDGLINQVCQKKGIATYRSATDELRLWEGSDFDVDAAIKRYTDRETRPTADLLSETYPLKPLVAQRHSYRTGTLRFFERQYIDKEADLGKLLCSQADCDGVIVYWLQEEAPHSIPETTVDGKPLLLISAANLSLLRVRAQEHHALSKIQQTESDLQTDKIALREVRHQRVQLKELLDETLTQAFNFGVHHNDCWVQGKPVEIGSITDFNALLSQVCDRIYAKTPILWNELINRRTLTSQGAKARRELLEAMLERPEEERLGLEGYGPEVAMYHSVLQQSGIHRREDGQWGFFPPQGNTKQGPMKRSQGTSDLHAIWEAMTQFCLDATDTPRSIGDLYQLLDAPPYGMKHGAIPVLLAAVLLHYDDEVSFFKDGTFVPVIGPEHFELLVKDPSRFSVKYISVTGVRSRVFRELEKVLREGVGKPLRRTGARNMTVLSVVKPLIQFVRRLPNFTLKTHRLSESSQAVLKMLLSIQDPDELIFKALPQACGIEPIAISQQEDDDGATARIFREQLVAALRDINAAYDNLLEECAEGLYDEFGVHSDQEKLRDELCFRASRLLGNYLEPALNRFAKAVTDKHKGDRQWLEAVIMVIADKPAESWTDEDFDRFKLHLGDIARRFKNLEALQATVKANNKGGFEARRVTVTRPDGTEVNRMVWGDDEHRTTVDPVIDDIFKQLPNERLREACLTRLAERMFDEDVSPKAATEVSDSYRQTKMRT